MAVHRTVILCLVGINDFLFRGPGRVFSLGYFLLCKK